MLPSVVRQRYRSGHAAPLHLSCSMMARDSNQDATLEAPIQWKLHLVNMIWPETPFMYSVSKVWREPLYQTI